MATYRILFARSTGAEETITLSDGAKTPVWDSMDVVERLVNELQGAGGEPMRLCRSTDLNANATAVRKVLERFSITYLQYAIEETGVRRTVRQSAERCSFPL